ncbi:MAG TPA: CHAT domain-containing tetratricopeptide repeat protein [Blastocatellia bacterium]|nr:CHAT domain-containing tetratricopeptide repeat protein [Blastocatellia bacterium]
MSRSLKNEERLAQYLLGLMAEEEMVELEEVYLLNDELNEELQAAERDLMDRYLEGSLSDDEQNRFETFFLSSPGRMERLRFARALKAYGSKLGQGEKNGAISGAHGPWAVLNSFTRSYAGIAALAVLVIALGLVAWRLFFFRSPEQQAMLALGKAYHAGRLFESRIYGFDYAPMAQGRGDGERNIDTINLSQAELIAVKEAADRPGSRSFHTLGRVYLAEQRFAEALEWLRKAAEAGPEDAGVQSDLGAVLLENARQNPDPGERAEEMTESLDRLNKAVELDDALLEARFNRALWYEYMRLPERAEAEWRSYLRQDSGSGWADEARRRLKALEERKRRSYENRGRDFEDFVASAARGDEATAWKILSRNRNRNVNTITQRLIDEYIESAERDGAPDARAGLRLLSLAGRLEVERAGDRFTADLADFFMKTTAAERRLIGSARGLLKSGFDSYRKSEYEKAAQFYQRAGRGFTQAGDACEAAVAQFGVGACSLRAPDADQALAVFERLAAYSSHRAYRLLLAQSLTSIADAQASRREFSKSLDNAARAMEIFESIQDVSGMLWSLQAPVLMNQQFGEFYESIGFAIHGLEVADSFSPGPSEIWPFYQQIASNFNALGFPAVALEFQTTALGLAAESGAPLLKSRSYALLALIYQKLHNYQDAVKNGELGLAEAQAIEGQKGKANLIANSTLNLAHLYREMAAFDQALSYYNQAIELHRRMNLKIYVAEAHKGKLQSLIGLGDERAIVEQINTSISLLEEDRPRILEDGNRNNYFDLAQETYDLAIDFTYSHLNDSRAAFAYSEASRARSLLDLVLAGGKVVTGRQGPEVRVSGVARPLSLAEIQRRLPEQSQILQYAVLEDKVIAWVISRDSVESASQAVTLAELTDQVTRFLVAIAESRASDSPEVIGRGKSLYDLLIKPVKADLEPNGVVFIVPDKILNYLPFGAMICPESEKYFVEDYLFELAPSSSITTRCSEQARDKAKLRHERLLAVGNPSFDRVEFPSLPDLPSAAAEAESVAGLYDDSVALTGQQAQPRRVKSLILDADVIHFAGHYVTNESSPMLSKLLLSKEAFKAEGDGKPVGALTASDVYGMNLHRARLVVLSACQTGVERYYRGEGAIGIARPFIKAGAPVVVATLWPVESEQTSRLMVAFHRHRKTDGLSAARALRQAQLDMLTSPETNNRNPHVWAAFVTIGGFAEF